MKTAGKLLLGALALGIVAIAPVQADAAPRDRSLVRVLAKIDSQIDDLRGMRSPHRKAAKIDALQADLRRLERRTEHRRSRRARRAAATIDALQARLNRIERRLVQRMAYRNRSHFRDSRRGGIRWQHRYWSR